MGSYTSAINNNTHVIMHCCECSCIILNAFFSSAIALFCDSLLQCFVMKFLFIFCFVFCFCFCRCCCFLFFVLSFNLLLCINAYSIINSYTKTLLVHCTNQKWNMHVLCDLNFKASRFNLARNRKIPMFLK